MDSKQAAHMNSSLNSIAKTLMSINRNLVSLVEQSHTVPEGVGHTLTQEELAQRRVFKRPWHPPDADIYRLKHPERCPQVDSDGPPEGMDPHWPHREDPICPDCKGTGQVLPAAVDMSDHCPCPTCEGSGDSTYHQEEIVSDCGKMLTPTQQVRSDDPPTQQTIDDTVEALKNLKWWLRHSSEQTQHLDHLIKQLEEIQPVKIPCPDTGKWDPLGQGGGG